MVNFYVNRILKGKLTLDKVPATWRAAVERELNKPSE